MKMPKGVRRVRLDPTTDILHILEDVHLDKAPRLIEREREPLAVVVDRDEYVGYPTTPKSKRFEKELLSSAGV